jgi:type I restriction enzyme M protein
LTEICDAFELERPSRAAKDELVDLLARSKRASFAAILEVLKREELKEICRGRGFDESGKEKSSLIARILGEEKPAKAAPAQQLELSARDREEESAVASESATKGKRGRAAKASSSESTANLGFEATMWSAADKLRNNMDAAEY